MRQALIFGPMVIGLFATSPALGRTATVPVQFSEGAKGTIAVQTGGVAQMSETLTIHENEEIVFADLTFNDELAAGIEIEVWPQVEGETPPWDLSGESFPFERNLWITDERTGSFVRFDVTSIVRAWESEQIPNLGFVLRITNEEDLGEEPQSASQLTFKAPKNVTLNYHILPVRPPKDVVQPPPNDGKDPKKLPRGEDGAPH